jgi:xanthine dehydrogenase YagR molybdenum-binding subunit
MRGLGWALHQSTKMDKAAARYSNDTRFLVTVSADVDQRDVILIPGQDDRCQSYWDQEVGRARQRSNGRGFTNAVHHATGQRSCDLPVRIDKLRG